MKKKTHPQTRKVVFQDSSAQFSYLTESTVSTKETVKWEDGKEYPLIKVEVSSASHPFYTGQHRLVDAEGRAEKFMKKYGARGFSKKGSVQKDDAKSADSENG